MKTLSKKKKIIILSVMIALLLVTGYVNVALNSSLSNSTQTSANNVTANFYTTYRDKREATRTQEIQFYDSIIASTSASEDSKKEAEKNKAGRSKADGFWPDCWPCRKYIKYAPHRIR